MAEVNAEVEAKVDAAFSAGFDGTPPAEIPPVKVVEDPAPEPAKPAVIPAPVPEKPQYVRLTKQEWDNTKAAAGKVSTLESQVAKLVGSMPKAEQIIQQVIEKVQAATPAGSPVELTDDDFAEWKETFPEVGDVTRKSLEKIVKRLNVRGTAAPALDPDAIDKAVDARLKARDDAALAATQEKELKGLEETYPDWGKIVGQPLAMGTKEPVETDWRKWATTNDPAVITSTSPAEVQASIAKFMESQKSSTPAKPDKAAARRAVIADAETPRAEGNPPPLNAPMSAEEAFGSGFKAAKRH